MEVIGILLLVGIVALLRSKLRRDGGPDIGWSTNGSAALVTAAPAAHLERGGERAVARELGRVESRHLAGSFSLAIGIAFTLLIVVLFGIVWSGDFNEAWESIWVIAPISVYPLVGMTIIGVHAAATRERRDGTAELFESCPAPPRARTAGYLRTAWVPVVVVVGYVALFALAMIWRSSAFGPIPLRFARRCPGGHGPRGRGHVPRRGLGPVDPVVAGAHRRRRGDRPGVLGDQRDRRTRPLEPVAPAVHLPALPRLRRGVRDSPRLVAPRVAARALRRGGGARAAARSP